MRFLQVNDLLEKGEAMQLKLVDKEAILRRVRAQVKELEGVNTAQRDRLEAMEAKLATLQEAQSILAGINHVSGHITQF